MEPITAASTFTNTLAVNGLATGLDSDKIIEGLLAVQQGQVLRLQNKHAVAQAEQQAYKSVEAKLIALQGSLGNLIRAKNGAFDARVATSSDENILTAAASSSATPGTYTVRVNNLARTHQIISQGFDDDSSEITQGTIQIGVGSASTIITIDDTNNTLSGLANAINLADLDITATVINDGKSQPYRLVLSSNKTGKDNAVTLTNNLAADSGNARKPELGASYIGNAFKDVAFSGTSSPTSSAGAGGYTGIDNDTYSFTVVTGGTVGTDNGIQISYTDSSGTNTGTITVDSGDADVFKTAAEGVQVKFNAGTLVAGDKFTVDVFVPTIQEALDSSVTFGSGAGALTINSDNNQVDELINGVTLDLRGADANKEISITIANDINQAKTAILDFVDAFNDFVSFIDEQIRYDAETDVAGILLGDRDAVSIQDRVRRVVIDTVPGITSSLNRLGALGISINDKGTLTVDEGKLDDVLSGNVDPFTLADVHKLFALTGESTNAGIQFISGSTRTVASATPYQIDITQAATQATVTAANTLSANTTIDATNDSLTVTVDGSQATLTLTHGSFTRLGLAQMLEAQLNTSEDLPGRKVEVSLQNDTLTLTSAAYGSISEVTTSGGTALSALGLTGTETNKGTDVAGNFIVDGQVETASGTGQFLLGNVDNANTADLQVRVSLNASQILPGSDANLTVTRGLASQVDVVLNRLLDPVDGRLKTINNGFQDNIDDLLEAIDRQNELLDAKRQTLVLQFIQLEQTVSQLQSTGSFLATQLSNLPSFQT